MLRNKVKEGGKNACLWAMWKDGVRNRKRERCAVFYHATSPPYLRKSTGADQDHRAVIGTSAAVNRWSADVIASLVVNIRSLDQSSV